VLERGWRVGEEEEVVVMVNAKLRKLYPLEGDPVPIAREAEWVSEPYVWIRKSRPHRIYINKWSFLYSFPTCA